MRNTDKIFGAFFAIWLIGVALSLSLTGFLIWAIYRLVIHFTA